MAIDTTAGGGGAVTITGKLDSLTSSRNLDINSGTAVTQMTDDIGDTLAFTSLDINAVAGDSTNTGGVTLGGNIGGTAAGSGNTQIGNTKTTGAITLSGTTYFTSGTLDFKSNGVGGSYVINNASDVTIKTTGVSTVTFGTNDLTIGNAKLTIDTDPGDTGANGADITFGGNILGASGGVAADLELDADTADVIVLGIGLSLIHISEPTRP